MHQIDATALLEMAATILARHGATDRECRVVGEHLVDANLAGHDSHGVIRLSQYVDDIRAGQIRCGCKHELARETTTSATVFAAGLFGQVACHDATQMAIDKASETGIAVVSVSRANHTGRLGTYGEMCALSGMIGIVFGNSGGRGQWVAPFGGRERRLSTNPMVIAAPSDKGFPLLLDISSCTAPEGKIRNYLHRGEEVPEGWLVDASGNPTTDPRSLYADPPAAILPIGGPLGYKGYGLAVMIDVLAGAFSGAGCATPEAATDQGSGHSALTVIAFRAGLHGDVDGFAVHVRELIDYLQSCPPAVGHAEVLVPGEFEHRNRAVRRRDGIPVPDTTWNQLQELASS